MSTRWYLTGLLLCHLSALLPLPAVAATQHADPELTLEFLEFLANFGAVDEETFQVIQQHAEQDIENKKQRLRERNHENH